MFVIHVSDPTEPFWARQLFACLSHAHSEVKALRGMGFRVRVFRAEPCVCYVCKAPV